MLLFEIFGLELASYSHMVYSMIYEVSHALGIYCFTIRRKRPYATGVPASPTLGPAKPPAQPERSATSPARSRKHLVG